MDSNGNLIDSGSKAADFLTSFTETDPTVPNWAKQTSSPVVTQTNNSAYWNNSSRIFIKASSVSPYIPNIIHFAGDGYEGHGHFFRFPAVDSYGSWESPIGIAGTESPSFSGRPTAPTASSGTNTTQLATTAFVQGEISDLEKKTLIINLPNESGYAPSGTYNQIKAALSEDREVIIRIEYAIDNYRYYTLESDTDDVVGMLYFYAYASSLYSRIMLSGDDSYSISHLSVNQSYGNINTSGQIGDTSVSISNGDGLIISDTSNSNKISKASITFDGSTTTKALTKKGTWENFATLDSNGKVPSSQLPSYVDDIIEGYLYSGSFYEEDSHTTVITPESGKIYIDLSSNKTYRWSGTVYVEISESLAIGTTQGTAADGGIVDGHVNDSNIHVTASDKAAWNAKYTKPVSGILRTDLESSVQTSLGKADTAVQESGVLIPNFDALTPIQTIEYDVNATTYYQIFSRANTGISTLMSEVNDVAKLRITVTGTDIYSQTDVLVMFQPGLIYPKVFGNHNTYSTTAATTGLYQLRAIYPTTLNNASYPWMLEFRTYNAIARHIKIEVFSTTENIAWITTKTATVYDSSYFGQGTVYAYSYRGFFCLGGNNQMSIGGSANNAAYATSYHLTWMHSNSILPLAGEALISNALVYISNGKFFKITNKNQPIETDTGIMLIATNYAVNAAVTYASARQKTLWTPLTDDAALTYDTFDRGDQVYLRCTVGNDGKLYSDGHLSKTKTNGYAWVHVGTAGSDTSVNLDTCGKPFMYLDSEGNASLYNGNRLSPQQINGIVFETTFLKKESLGSSTGSGKLEKIGGNSFVCNQLADKTLLSNTGYTYSNTSGETFTVNGNGSDSNCTNTKFPFAANHVYYYRFYVRNLPSTTDVSSCFQFYDADASKARIQVTNKFVYENSVNGVYETKGFFSNTEASSDYRVRIRLDAQITYSNTIFGYPVIIDLTQMFGEGNEPATVEEFEQLFPLDYYDYNAGTVINGAANGFKTTDANDTQLSSISLPITTMTGKPSGSSTSEVMFPNGLCGVSNVHDEINFVTGKAIKRIGSRSYTSGDENDNTVLTDKTNTVYVLATPVEYDIDTIPNTSFLCQQGGKEMWLPEHSSTPTIAPLDSSIRYGEDTSSVIAALMARIEALESTINT